MPSILVISKDQNVFDTLCNPSGLAFSAIGPVVFFSSLVVASLSSQAHRKTPQTSRTNFNACVDVRVLRRHEDFVVLSLFLHSTHVASCCHTQQTYGKQHVIVGSTMPAKCSSQHLYSTCINHLPRVGDRRAGELHVARLRRYHV